MKRKNINTFSPQCAFKVVVIGAGNVGATTTYALLLDGTPTDLALIDINKEKAEGVILDMYHSLPLLSKVNLSASDDFAHCAGANLVVITAGARQLEGETRLDLIAKNKAIFADIIPKIAKAAPDTLLLVVSNPVDVLTKMAIDFSGFSPNRVFGSGTMLDTMRFRYHLSQKLALGTHSINAYILGEHGDSSFPFLSGAQIGGVSLKKWPGIDKKKMEEAYKETQQAAYKIIHDIGYTCYSIATVITEIVRQVFDDSHEILPLSAQLDSFYSRKKIALSVPCVLGRNGIINQVHLNLDRSERKNLEKSIKIVGSYLK